MSLENISNKNTGLDEIGFIDKVNKLLFDWELDDIIEVTYDYKDLWSWIFLNNTLFQKFIWETFQDNIEELYEKTLSKLENKRKIAFGFLHDLQQEEATLNKKMLILKWSLNYVVETLNFTIVWLVFEAEKAWYNHHLSESEVESKVQELEEIEKKLFDGNVRDNQYEVDESYKVLHNLFRQSKSVLSQSEQKRFSYYLSQMKRNVSVDVMTNDNEKNTDSQTEKLSILDKEVPRQDYIEIFRLVFEICNINIPVIVEERDSIYDWKDALHIPLSKIYETLPLEKVLWLITHEIETHYHIQGNNSKVIGNFRWWKNLQREDGVAMIMEWILKGKKIEDFWISDSIPMIYAWEIFVWEDLLDFLTILSKLKWIKKIGFLRRKRLYPLDYRWVQHKDTSYSRWIQKVIQYIKKWWDIKTLFIAKVFFEDLDLAKSIIDSTQWLTLQYPLFVAELLLFVLSWNSLNEEAFRKHLSKKYPFLEPKNEIDNNTVSRLTFSTKKKIIEILDILQKD